MEDIKADIQQWWIQEGNEPLCPDLELDDNLLPNVSSSEPLPPLPAPDQVAEARVLDVFISSNFLEYLSPSRIRDLHHRYRSFPASLIEDQLALLFACLCVGTSLDLRANPGDESRAVAWYRHTVDSLQRWGGSSCTALQAMHILQHFLVLFGSMSTTRHNIESILPRDNLRNAPFLRRREFETGMPPKPGLGPENFTAQPVLIQLKLLENQVLNDIHSGEVDTSSVEYVLSTEARNRVLLRAPLMFDSLLGLSSLSVVARSSAQILLGYQRLLQSQALSTSWPQMRRTIACGYLLVRCFWRCELQQQEAESLMAVLYELLDHFSGRWPAAHAAILNFLAIADKLGLVVRRVPAKPSTPAASDTVLDFIWDAPVNFQPTDMSQDEMFGGAAFYREAAIWNSIFNMEDSGSS
ncbi:hypothetical protein EHS25_005645 [Saitozyma podzolica]|uniref:Transcription factor domain-containing protein n=1 Tax=Saitozyma podzolica TaxID=1890683 RepID=A0A427XVJ3_9TREE|nr:hypothetical protein EHS25_005645 [Saitozyma podzolica]